VPVIVRDVSRKIAEKARVKGVVEEVKRLEELRGPFPVRAELFYASGSFSGRRWGEWYVLQ
jgi:hypothetical protein